MTRSRLLLLVVAGTLAIAAFLTFSGREAAVLTLENGLGEDVRTSSL